MSQPAAEPVVVLDPERERSLITLGHDPGIACHTGRHSCFYSVLREGQWQAVDPVLKDPGTIYT